MYFVLYRLVGIIFLMTYLLPCNALTKISRPKLYFIPPGSVAISAPLTDSISWYTPTNTNITIRYFVPQGSVDIYSLLNYLISWYLLTNISRPNLDFVSPGTVSIAALIKNSISCDAPNFFPEQNNILCPPDQFLLPPQWYIWYHTMNQKNCPDQKYTSCPLDQLHFRPDDSFNIMECTETLQYREVISLPPDQSINPHWKQKMVKNKNNIMHWWNHRKNSRKNRNIQWRNVVLKRSGEDGMW